jgi:hypothetical protein
MLNVKDQTRQTKNSIVRLNPKPFPILSKPISRNPPKQPLYQRPSPKHISFPHYHQEAKQIRQSWKHLVHPPQQSVIPPKPADNLSKHQFPKLVKSPVVAAVPATTPTVPAVTAVLVWLGLLFAAGGFGFGFFTFVAR